MKHYPFINKSKALKEVSIKFPELSPDLDSNFDAFGKEFWNWFGNSKAVNKHGDPIIYYRGIRGPHDYSKGFCKNGARIYLTPSYQFAKEVAGNDSNSRIIAVYVKVENPFEFWNPEHVKMFEEESGHKMVHEGVYFDFGAGSQNIIEELGFDGFYEKEYKSSTTINLCVFSPEQVVKVSGEALTESKALKEAAYKTLHPNVNRLYNEVDNATEFFNNVQSIDKFLTTKQQEDIRQLQKDSNTLWDCGISSLKSDLDDIYYMLLPKNWKKLSIININSDAEYKKKTFDKLIKFCQNAIEEIPISVARYTGLGGRYEDIKTYRDLEIPEEYESELNWSSAMIPYLQLLEKVLQHAKSYLRFFENIGLQIKKYYQQREGAGPEGQENFPEDVNETEILWHTTTNYKKILEEGFKTRKELEELQGKSAGLGGGPNDVISFTADYEVAEGIKDAIIDLVLLLQEPRTIKYLKGFMKEEGLKQLPHWVWNYVLGKGNLQREETVEDFINKPEIENAIIKDEEAVLNWYSKGFLSYAQQEGLRYNPVFFGVVASNFKDIDPDQIGIIEALVNIQTKGISYLSSMEEWRIPKSALISYGAVGSQSEK